MTNSKTAQTPACSLNSSLFQVNHSQHWNRLLLWASAFLSPLYLFHPPQLWQAFTCARFEQKHHCAFGCKQCLLFCWRGSKTHISSLCSFCLLQIPVIYLAARPASKPGPLNDMRSSGLVHLSRSPSSSGGLGLHFDLPLCTWVNKWVVLWRPLYHNTVATLIMCSKTTHREVLYHK